MVEVPALGRSLCAVNDGLGGFVGASGEEVPLEVLRGGWGMAS